MKPTYIKPMWLSALCVGAVMGACSNDAEQAPAIGTADEAPGRIEFTISLPGGSGVLYPTRMIQSGYECKISRLDVFEFRDKRDNDGNPVMWDVDGTQVRAKEFVKYHPYEEISLHTAQEPNQYTFSINKEEGSGDDKHYFFFIANHDQEGLDVIGETPFQTIADEVFGSENEESETKSFFHDPDVYGLWDYRGWEIGSFNDPRIHPASDLYSSNDKLNKLYGMRMSGVATSTRHGAIGGENDATGIKIPENGSVQCFVDMTRVAARIDLYSDAPNLVITDATLYYDFCAGFPFTNAKPETDWSIRLDPQFNWQYYHPSATCDVMLNDDATVTDRLFADGKDFADTQAIQQWTDAYDKDHGVQRAFYCYETPNRIVYENLGKEGVTYVEVKFQLEDGTTGHVDVPFTKTDEDGNTVGVDIVRNNLYRVVIGDGKRIVPGAEIKVSIKDVPWEVVDLPAIVD